MIIVRYRSTLTKGINGALRTRAWSCRARTAQLSAEQANAGAREHVITKNMQDVALQTLQMKHIYTQENAAGDASYKE